jgi:DNA replication protein DnaC
MTGDEYEQFLREDQQARLARFYKRRPPAFAKRGWLTRDVHQWLEGMVRGENRTLALEGPTGTGKSWSLWKCVETLLVNGWRGRWEIVTATDFAEVIRPPVDDERLRRIRECEFLALDDLGSWRIKEWGAEHLYAIVDHRSEQELPVVVASNIPDMVGKLGDRIGSRLAEGLTQVKLGGPDRRAS